MKSTLMALGPALMALALFVCTARSATYYIRIDGGSSDQCTGLVDASYPGTGTGLPCAWSHPFWALSAAGGTAAWKLQGGDTLMIGAGSYEMGYGAPNTGWCDSAGAFTCHLPSLPSGPNALTPTRLLGQGYNAGCPSPPELWGTQRTDFILNLSGTSHAEVACLELTDHSQCIEFFCPDPGGTGCSPSVACERDTYPYGPWASTGIFARDSADLRLQNLNIHGLANQGIWAGRLADWTVEDVRIAANGWAGWNGDIGGDSSNSGSMVFRRWTVEWNGCGESYPGLQPEHCWEQVLGGYGDGVGTGATGGDWLIEDSLFRYNTSDGLDLLYVGGDAQYASSIVIRQSLAFANAGDQMKVSGPTQVVNSVMISHCSFFDGKSFTESSGVFNHCRAGGSALALNPQPGSVIDVVNSTLAGEGDCLVIAECRVPGACNGTEQIRLRNSLFLGYTDYLQPGDTTCFLYDPSGFADTGVSYNLFWGAKFGGTSPCDGGNNLCQDPLLVNDTLAAFDGHLQTGSPALDNGLPVGSLGGLVPSDDRDGNSRPVGTGVDRGAYEYGSGSLATPTPSPPPGPSPTPTISASPTATPWPCDCPDADGDGVPDAWDRCPGTGASQYTDSSGCPGARLSTPWPSILVSLILLLSLLGLAVRKRGHPISNQSRTHSHTLPMVSCRSFPPRGAQLQTDAGMLKPVCPANNCCFSSG